MFKFLVLSTVSTFAYRPRVTDDYEAPWKSEKTIFLIEVIRHGARSAENHYERTSGKGDEEIFRGIPPGYLTERGVQESREIGKKRREEYVEKKHLLGWTYD